MSAASHPDKCGGTYILLLESFLEKNLSVGKLGEISLSPDWYAYVGSAFGPGGVAARCNHHRKISTRPHWHIDYLRAVCELRQIWFSHDQKHLEHDWSNLLIKSRGSSQPFAGFGASDCDCNSHLFHFQNIPSFDGFRRRASDGDVRNHEVCRDIID